MAAPDELFCWEGDWGLPSVDTDCLVVLVSELSRPGRAGPEPEPEVGPAPGPGLALALAC